VLAGSANHGALDFLVSTWVSLSCPFIGQRPSALTPSPMWIRVRPRFDSRGAEEQIAEEPIPERGQVGPAAQPPSDQNV